MSPRPQQPAKHRLDVGACHSRPDPHSSGGKRGGGDGGGIGEGRRTTAAPTPSLDRNQSLLPPLRPGLSAPPRPPSRPSFSLRPTSDSLAINTHPGPAPTSDLARHPAPNTLPRPDGVSPPDNLIAPFFTPICLLLMSALFPASKPTRTFHLDLIFISCFNLFRYAATSLVRPEPFRPRLDTPFPSWLIPIAPH